MALIVVPMLRQGRRVHLVPKLDGRRWDRTLCNVSLSDDWRELTADHATRLGFCPNCANRTAWLQDLFEWIQAAPSLQRPPN